MGRKGRLRKRGEDKRGEEICEEGEIRTEQIRPCMDSSGEVKRGEETNKCKDSYCGYDRQWTEEWGEEQRTKMNKKKREGN